MKGISKEEKILFLENKINEELKKPTNEMDIDKASKYVDELLYLRSGKNTMTPEEIKERVAKIPFK